MTDRRDVLLAGAAALAGLALPRAARAQAGAAERHGMSTFGDLNYGPDARHFDYVNPAAPKGGVVSLQISSTFGNQAFDTFNTLNVYVLKGDGAAGMNMTFDSLMSRALDEPDALYGLLARSVATSADGLTQTFRLRPEARFHDGSRVTAHDAAFSLTVLKEKGHPLISQTIRMMAAAEALDDATLVVRYDKGRSRDLPLTVAQLPIFSKAYYASRPFEEATLEAPLGSGPYKAARFEQGRFIEFARVPDYWGRDLAVNVGQNNFDRVRFEYYRDRQVALEGFKAGTITFREEFTSRDWASAYDIPAVREGRVKRETIPDETPSGAQGWYFNLRRDAFKDRRVRDALGQLFDFEWTNANIMFGAYRRTASWFENSPMKAEGPPSPEELALLAPFRGRVPDEVFGPPFTPPVTDGTGQDRNLLRRADALLREAGCRREGATLRLPGGQAFEVEFLDFSGSLQPHTASLIKNMKLLGIEARYRIVDAAQYQRRVDAFDFDIITRRTSMGVTPGEGLPLMFGSRAAAIQGSSNIAGIADPAVDAMIAAALAADTRDELTTACRALDRVLRAGRYWIPMWYKPEHWLAYWDMFGRPDTKPKYDRGAPGTWWYDEAKAKRIGKA
ncbi:extracellular solute-binding protein [Alsobacter sp. SYSU M60028]|uniref:Extracellular solute-binding protein n=1 Tax=Alsobacter ponti TaxID=2962936 RepID=A0ABT1LCY8_9HYPH|nr:extracellular solute-binding protein [Alsobacter ponti]MCP8938118.1 extracellular solute-binding protein [Alsobacter ponti]